MQWKRKSERPVEKKASEKVRKRRQRDEYLTLFVIKFRQKAFSLR